MEPYSLNAFISLAGGASILRKAEAADTQRDRGPLHGRLIAIKDNICTSELPTTSASGILKTFTSPYDATVVKKIQKAGGIVSGKTNLDEFGMGSHSKCSYFGAVTQNDASRGEALLPAAYTGIIGFKPSYGLVSRWGVLAYANSLDTVGVLAQSTQHAEAVFEAINGYDEQDPTSLTPTTRTRISNLLSQRRRNSSLRIGVPLEYNIAELSPEVRRAWICALELLRNQGHTILPVSLPTTKRALSAYYVLAPAEASSNLAKYDGVRYGTRAEGPDGAEGVLFSKTRGQGFGDEVKRRVLLGAYTLSAEAIDNYFIQAQKVRRLVQQDFDRVFSLANPLLDVGRTGRQNTDEKVDVLVCPTAPTLPPTLESLEKQSPVEAYVSDVFTVPASLAGLPAVSVPFKASQGQEGEGEEGNIGIQVIAQYGDDNLTLDVARIIEETR
ncbi:Trimeric GatFAB AmidoTransferase(AdT) complex subunit [Coniosporium tulheliwenetii]|uniref:Trimeric GatFAB AmidoTransferase(AdT) complex subunit n=1 Tax=Coniosporium tulheliwenetii TaxID=3383036 RepID=A0ACC2ZPW6_9PEZI|nr:Trimeric GatFAB AmidoTransferase(AdT) complex subunit [Cladosporium sp. JES 115]